MTSKSKDDAIDHAAAVDSKQTGSALLAGGTFIHAFVVPVECGLKGFVNASGINRV